MALGLKINELHKENTEYDKENTEIFVLGTVVFCSISIDEEELLMSGYNYCFSL